MTAAYQQLIRWAFTRFYREFAWSYDTVAAFVSGGEWHRWVLAAQPLLQGDVLELGCGTGNLQVELAQQGIPAIGLDVSRQMLNIASGKLRRLGFDAPLLRANAGAIPLPDAVVDTVVATFPSEYIIAPATVNEIRRVLRPGGQLIVLLGATYHEGTPYRRAIDLLYRVTLQRPVLSQPAQEPPPPSPLAAHFAAAGFHSSNKILATPHADLHVIVAARPRHKTPTHSSPK